MTVSGMLCLNHKLRAPLNYDYILILYIYIHQEQQQQQQQQQQQHNNNHNNHNNNNHNNNNNNNNNIQWVHENQVTPESLFPALSATSPSSRSPTSPPRVHIDTTGWWLNQPIWKICISQIGSFPQIGMKKTKYLKPPPSQQQWFGACMSDFKSGVIFKFQWNIRFIHQYDLFHAFVSTVAIFGVDVLFFQATNCCFQASALILGSSQSQGDLTEKLPSCARFARFTTCLVFSQTIKQPARTLHEGDTSSIWAHKTDIQQCSSTLQMGVTWKNKWWENIFVCSSCHLGLCLFCGRLPVKRPVYQYLLGVPAL